MEENKLISYEMFFKKTLIVETLFHEEKKMISLRFQSKAPAKYQEFFFSPYTLFNPLNAHIPTDLTFPCPPPTKINNSILLFKDFFLKLLGTCQQYYTSYTFHILDISNST